MTDERTANIAADRQGPDRPVAWLDANRVLSGREFGEPAIQDRSMRSLLILMGHEQEQNGAFPH